jgi:integrase/recombinase XerD
MKDPSQVRVTGPLGPYAKGFRAELARQGYASSSAVNQLKLVGHLSRWMTIEGLSAPELVPVEIERYVAARRAACYRHNLSEQGLRPLPEYLRGLGVLAGPAPSSPATPHERLLEDYASYLVAERSLASGTVRYYLRFARLFVSSVSDETGLGLGAITTGDVSRFVVEQCGRRSVGSARTLVMALRSLLRFLHVTGLSATPAVHGQRAGHGDTLIRRPDSLRGEGDVRIVGAVEEVSRAQVRVAAGVLGVDGRRGHRDGAADLAVRRHGAVHRSQAP